MRRQQLTPTPDPRADPVSHYHGRAARHGRGFTRRATHAVVALAVAASTVLLAGCENANRHVSVTFVNHTDQDLQIIVRNELRAYVRAQDTEVSTIGGSGTCCSDVSAVTEDGKLIAENPGKLCQGDTWVIEPTNLVPVEDTDKTPTPSPGGGGTVGRYPGTPRSNNLTPAGRAGRLIFVTA